VYGRTVYGAKFLLSTNAILRVVLSFLIFFLHLSFVTKKKDKKTKKQNRRILISQQLLQRVLQQHIYTIIPGDSASHDSNTPPCANSPFFQNAIVPTHQCADAPLFTHSIILTPHYHVAPVANPVISHEWGKDRGMLMTSGTIVRFDQKQKNIYRTNTFFLSKAIEHFPRKIGKKYETFCYR